MVEARSRFSIARIAFGASVVLSLGLVASAMFGANGIERHEKLKGELDNVRTLNDGLKADNVRLRGQAKALRSDPEYIESVIRDELGYVKKDEMVFIFPSAPRPAAAKSSDVKPGELRAADTAAQPADAEAGRASDPAEDEEK